jgi:hypothetical protein
MADTEYMTLRAAVDKLNDNGLDARLYVITDMLALFATLTRHNFNDGQEEEVFFIGVHDGRVLRESLEGKISAFKARMAAGERASEISPRSMLDLKQDSAVA